MTAHERFAMDGARTTRARWELDAVRLPEKAGRTTACAHSALLFRLRSFLERCGNGAREHPGLVADAVSVVERLRQRLRVQPIEHHALRVRLRRRRDRRGQQAGDAAIEADDADVVPCSSVVEPPICEAGGACTAASAPCDGGTCVCEPINVCVEEAEYACEDGAACPDGWTCNAIGVCDPPHFGEIDGASLTSTPAPTRPSAPGTSSSRRRATARLRERGRAPLDGCHRSRSHWSSSRASRAGELGWGVDVRRRETADV